MSRKLAIAHIRIECIDPALYGSEAAYTFLVAPPNSYVKLMAARYFWPAGRTGWAEHERHGGALVASRSRRMHSLVAAATAPRGSLHVRAATAYAKLVGRT